MPAPTVHSLPSLAGSSTATSLHVTTMNVTWKHTKLLKCKNLIYPLKTWWWKRAVGVYSHRPFTCSSLQVKFLGVIEHFVCFFMPMKIVFVNFIGAIIKDRCCGMKIFHLINLENFLKRQPGQLLRVNKSQNSAEFYGNQWFHNAMDLQPMPTSHCRYFPVLSRKKQFDVLACTFS